jgi:hypothetical protein
VAVITIDARLMAVIFDCPQCGPPAPLTRPDELRDLEKLIRDHQRSTGHRPTVIKQGTSYLTLRFDGCEIRSGPMPRG